MSGSARQTTRHLGRKLVWFAALWGAGVAVVAALAYAIRLMIL